MTIDVDRLDQQVKENLDLAQGAPDPVAQAVRDALTTYKDASGHHHIICGRLGMCHHVTWVDCHGTGRVPRVWHPDPTEAAEEAAWCGRLIPVADQVIVIAAEIQREDTTVSWTWKIAVAFNENARIRLRLHAALDALTDCLRALQGAQP